MRIVATYLLALFIAGCAPSSPTPSPSGGEGKVVKLSAVHGLGRPGPQRMNKEM